MHWRPLPEQTFFFHHQQLSFFLQWGDSKGPPPIHLKVVLAFDEKNELQCHLVGIYGMKPAKGWSWGLKS